jgi:hypothetical protein
MNAIFVRLYDVKTLKEAHIVHMKSYGSLIHNLPRSTL